MRSFSLPQRDDAAPHLPGPKEWQVATWRTLRVIGGLVVLGLLIAAAYGAAASFAHAARFVLWGLGLLLVGAFVGFLFGLPRVLPGASVIVLAAPVGSANAGGTEESGAGGVSAETTPGDRPRPATSPEMASRGNDSMLEIADWLTKIIAGLGLVNLHKVPELLNRLAFSIAGPADGLRGDGLDFVFFPFGVGVLIPGVSHHHSFALAVAVFFPAIGVLLGYLVTRLYLQTALIASDRDTIAEYTRPPSREFLIRQYKNDEAKAQAVAAGRKLPEQGPAPVAATVSELDALNERYASVRLADYRARVKEKDNLAQRLYNAAVERGVPKSWLSDQSGDGYLHVLATSALADPVKSDVEYLLRAGAGARMKHVRFRVAQAVQKLLSAELVAAEQVPLLISLLKSYQIEADPSLRKLSQLALDRLM